MPLLAHLLSKQASRNNARAQAKQGSELTLSVLLATSVDASRARRGSSLYSCTSTARNHSPLRARLGAVNSASALYDRWLQPSACR